MDWLNKVGGVLGGGEDASPAGIESLLKLAPEGMLQGALASAFRSGETPPFAQMLSQIFAGAGGEQRSALLNALLPVLKPALGAGLLSKFNLAGIIQDDSRVTPQEAAQVSPQAAASLAEAAEQKDGGVVDLISGLLAKNPDSLRSLGAGALGFIAKQLAR